MTSFTWKSYKLSEEEYRELAVGVQMEDGEILLEEPSKNVEEIVFKLA